MKKIARKENKKYPIFASRVSSEKTKEDWKAFVKAMKDKEEVNSKILLEMAIYTFMEFKRWDPEIKKFLDFDDYDEDDFFKHNNNTHIDPHEPQKSTPNKNPIMQEDPLNTIVKDEEGAVTASCETTGLQFTPTVKKVSNEDIFTYAFCKLFGDMKEVNYEQIEQLSLPIFKVMEERAIKNKPNILIANQCIVKKANDKKQYKIMNKNVQRFITQNQHIECVLKKEISQDFLDALTP